MVDDEAPNLATLFSSVGALPPDGSDAERARAFDTVMDGPGFAPISASDSDFRRLADAMAAGAEWKLQDARESSPIRPYERGLESVKCRELTNFVTG